MAVCLSCRVAAAQHLLQAWSRLGWYPREPSCSHNRAHIPAHGTTATTHSGLLARAAPPSIVSWLSVYPARLVEPLPVLTSRVLGARASLVGPSGREWTARVALHSCGSLYSAECTAGTAYIRETRQSHTRGQMSDERVQGAVRRAPPGVHVPGGARGRRRPPGCGGGADRDVPVQDRAHAHDCAPGAQPALTCRRLPLARCYAATSRQTWGRLRVARAAAGGLQPRVPCPGSAGAAAVSRVRMLQEREAAGAAECAAEAAQSSRDACGLVSNTLRQLCPRCTSISSHTARRPRPAAGRASSRCRGQRALCARRRASARSLCGRGPACARERGAPVMPRARRHARRAAAGPRAAVLVNCKKAVPTALLPARRRRIAVRARWSSGWRARAPCAASRAAGRSRPAAAAGPRSRWSSTCSPRSCRRRRSGASCGARCWARPRTCCATCRRAARRRGAHGLQSMASWP